MESEREPVRQGKCTIRGQWAWIKANGRWRVHKVGKWIKSQIDGCGDRKLIMWNIHADRAGVTRRPFSPGSFLFMWDTRRNQMLESHLFSGKHGSQMSGDILNCLWSKSKIFQCTYIPLSKVTSASPNSNWLSRGFKLVASKSLWKITQLPGHF